MSGGAIPERKTVGDREVLLDALAAMERIDGVTYGLVVMLQPTSPLRRAEHVSATVEEGTIMGARTAALLTDGAEISMDTEWDIFASS